METILGKTIENPCEQENWDQKFSREMENNNELLTKSQLSLFNSNNLMTNSLMLMDSSAKVLNKNDIYRSLVNYNNNNNTNSLRHHSTLQPSTFIQPQHKNASFRNSSVLNETNGNSFYNNKSVKNYKMNLNGYLSDSECSSSNNNNSRYNYKLNSNNSNQANNVLVGE